MNLRTYIVKGFFIWAMPLSFAAGIQASEELSNQRVSLGNFSLSLPLNAQDVTEGESDSAISKQYKAPGIYVEVDYGIYAGTPDFPSAIQIISGYAAQVGVTSYSVEIDNEQYTHFAMASFLDNGDGHNLLTITIYLKSHSEERVARDIFESIVFDNPGDGQIPDLPEAEIQTLEGLPEVHVSVLEENLSHTFRCQKPQEEGFSDFICSSPELSESEVIIWLDPRGFEKIRYRYRYTHEDGLQYFFSCLPSGEKKRRHCSLSAP